MKKLSIVLLILTVVVGLGPGSVFASPSLQAPMCEQDVTVQTDDWLSKLSDKFYGDVLAYPAIVEATNQANASDDSYARIDNPDLIEPGWKLCIPSAEEAAQMLGGGAPSAAAPAAVDPNRRISVIAVQHAECSWDSFWCTVQAGIQKGAEDNNVDVTVLAPDEFDLDKTASLIEQAVAANPDAIMLTVTDPVLFADPINRAIDAGIPVIAYNAGAGPIEDGIPYYTYLGQDEYQGGYLGGLRLAADGGTRGVCINQQVGHTGLDKRCQGFVDALSESGIPAEVLAIGDDPAEATTIIGDYYAANPDTDIFMTLGPNGANPFYAFLENEGLGAGDVTHGTFDLSDEINANIASGLTMFGIDQQPFLQGYGGIQTLQLLVRQGIVPALPVTPTGPGFVTQDNLSTVISLAGEYR